MWYRRSFRLEGWKEKNDRRLLLHFGAVDQSCVVLINGRRAARHTGGYLPFSADITKLVTDGENELVVSVKDLTETSWHARGKQRLKTGRNVLYGSERNLADGWMEEVPEQYIKDVSTETDIEKGIVTVTVEADEDRPVEIRIQKPRIYEEPSENAGGCCKRRDAERGRQGDRPCFREDQ